MKVSIEWYKNNLSHDECDPHHGAKHEGHHAVLCVEDGMSMIHLKMPESIYNLDSYKTLEKLVAKFKSFPSY